MDTDINKRCQGYLLFCWKGNDILCFLAVI